MDKKTYAEILSIVVGLAEFFKEDLSDKRQELYVSALEDFSPEQINFAAKQAVKTLKFFPRPVELIELIQGSQADRAEQAWQIAWEAYKRAGYYESVLFEDGAIARTIQIVYGGWIQFSEASRTLSPEMNRAKQKEFLSTYRRESRYQHEPQRLPGHFEIENLNSVSTWTRDQFSDTYRQKIFIASESGGRFVEANFHRNSAQMIESAAQLLNAAAVPELPAKPRLELLPAPSEEARRQTPDEIRAGIQSLKNAVRMR
jgi:hypothetical protein